jgi:hypothetical protein
MLDDGKIAQILARATSLQNGVRALIDEANRAGGRDNITVVAFRVEDTSAPDPANPGAGPGEGATLIGGEAEAAGLSATEVRRRAAAEAARKRREESEGRSPRRLRTALKLLVAILLIAAIAFGAWYGNRQIWFLGTDAAGRVALYRGAPYELPFGIDLYSERYSSPIQTESLPPRRKDAVTGHDLRSRDDAVSLLEEIETTAGLP